VDFSSADPLNGGAVRLEFAPANEQDPGVNTPTAPPGSEVEIDVYTEDQFGNLVGGIPVTVADNTVDAEIIADDADGAAGVQVLSNFDDDGDFAGTSDEEEDQTITGTWEDAPVLTYSGPDTQDLTDTVTINFQDIVVTEDGVTMTANPSGNVPVGTAVTETVTVLDDEGNPVVGAEVRFTQSGPGDANADVIRFTNANGQAFYTFNSAQAGTALITAVVQTNDAPVVKTDEVTFGGKVGINLKAMGPNNGKKADKLNVKANNNAAGLIARVFVKGQKVAQHKLNGQGDYAFTIKDKNGKKSTKYVVKVAGTATTKADQATKKLK